jgi:hypothetical protein
VYIATIFAVLECLTGRAGADEKSMDGVRGVVGKSDGRCRSCFARPCGCGRLVMHQPQCGVELEN